MVTEAPSFITGDKSAVDAPNSNELSEIRKLAEQQLDLEKQIATKEEELAKLQKEHRHVSEVSLPEAMANVGMQKFVLDSGETVDVKEDVFVNIRPNMIGAAAAFFEGKGLGSIVKDQIKVDLDLGDKVKAQQILKLADKLGTPAVENLSIHAGTLKSITKEQRKQGVAFPEDVFNIFDFKKTIIKAPKKK